MSLTDPFDIARGLDLPLASIELSAGVVVTDDLALDLEVSCHPGDTAALAGDPYDHCYDRLFTEGSVSSRRPEEGAHLARSVVLAPVVVAAVAVAGAQARTLLKAHLGRPALADLATLAHTRFRIQLLDGSDGPVVHLHTQNLAVAAG